jgi:hypothetical protein
MRGPANKNKKENSFPFFSFLYQPGHYFFVFLIVWPGWKKRKKEMLLLRSFVFRHKDTRNNRRSALIHDVGHDWPRFPFFFVFVGQSY